MTSCMVRAAVALSAVALLRPAGARAAEGSATSVQAASCQGEPDGTPCDDGDGCTANDGVDHCAKGACMSPGPCSTVTFKVRRGSRIVMFWKPPKVNPGASCDGMAFVSAEQVQAILGMLPSGPQAVTRNVHKSVPPSGKV